MGKGLTLRQSEALSALRRHGRLVRMPSGYWTTPTLADDAQARGQPVPSWSCGTNTVMGLISKGYAHGERFMRRGDPSVVAPLSREPDAAPLPVEQVAALNDLFRYGRLVRQNDGRWGPPPATDDNPTRSHRHNTVMRLVLRGFGHGAQFEGVEPIAIESARRGAP